MKNIKSFNEYAINESFSSFKEKAINLYLRVKHLFDINFTFTDNEKEALSEVNSIKDLYTLATSIKIKPIIDRIVNNNKDEIRTAYNEVFGLNEEICPLTIISIIIMVGFIWYSYGSRIKNMFKKKPPKKPYRYRDPDDDLDFLRPKEKDEEMY